MRLLDYLDLKGQNITEFALEVGERIGQGDAESIRTNEHKLNALTVRVWRHAHGKRKPGPEDIELYRDLTKGAVTADDWVEFALANKDQPPDAAHAAATG